jgi:hypothetical protein
MSLRNWPLMRKAIISHKRGLVFHHMNKAWTYATVKEDVLKAIERLYADDETQENVRHI